MRRFLKIFKKILWDTEANMTTCQFCAQVVKFKNLRLCDARACMEKWDADRKAVQAEAGRDERVAAIRADAAVGHGSCSSIDECYENTELLAALVQAGCQTPREAVKWAREVDGRHWESGLNQMSGEAETDSRIRACYEESQAAAKLPIDC